jgi:HSP20 family protein
MLMRTDPFRELDRVTHQLLNTAGTKAHPASVPMDAWRDGDMVYLHFDVPGIDPGSVTLDVQRNVLTISGDRKPAAPDNCTYLAAERPSGSFTRQVFLGDALDAERISAHYDQGVLQVQIPVSEKAKPRRVPISAAAGDTAVQLSR